MTVIVNNEIDLNFKAGIKMCKIYFAFSLQIVNLWSFYS